MDGYATFPSQVPLIASRSEGGISGRTIIGKTIFQMQIISCLQRIVVAVQPRVPFLHRTRDKCRVGLDFGM